MRLLSKVAEKYPKTEEPTIITDIHIRVSPDTGDVMAFNDEDQELTRIVVDEWINNPLNTEEFYKKAANVLHTAITNSIKNDVHPYIIEPYNYVLETEIGEHIAELYVVDDEETTIIGKPFMQDLDKDLDDFINNLLKE